MQKDEIDVRRPASLVEGAWAVIGSLMLIFLVAYVVAAAGWNPSGEPPTGSELWSTWQMIQ